MKPHLSLQVTTEDMTYYCAAADKFEMFCKMLLKKKNKIGLPLGPSRNRKEHQDISVGL